MGEKCLSMPLGGLALAPLQPRAPAQGKEHLDAGERATWNLGFPSPTTCSPCSVCECTSGLRGCKELLVQGLWMNLDVSYF